MNAFLYRFGALRRRQVRLLTALVLPTLLLALLLVLLVYRSEPAYAADCAVPGSHATIQAAIRNVPK